MSETETHKDVVRSYYEKLWNDQNFDLVSDIIAEGEFGCWWPLVSRLLILLSTLPTCAFMLFLLTYSSSIPDLNKHTCRPNFQRADGPFPLAGQGWVGQKRVQKLCGNNALILVELLYWGRGHGGGGRQGVLQNCCLWRSQRTVHGLRTDSQENRVVSMHVSYRGIGRLFISIYFSRSCQSFPLQLWSFACIRT